MKNLTMIVLIIKKSSLRELCDGEILNEFVAEFGEDNICENETG